MSQPFSYDQLSQPDGADFKKSLGGMMTRWYVFVIAILTTSLFALFINQCSTPTYNGTATILIKSDSNQPIGAEGLFQNFTFNPRNSIQNEIGILKSHQLANRTIQALPLKVIYYKNDRWISESFNTQLYKTAPFTVTIDTIIPQLVEERFNITILDRKKFKLSINKDLKTRTINHSAEYFFDEKVKTADFSFTVHLNGKYNSALFDPIANLKDKDYQFKANDMNLLNSQLVEDLKVDIFYKDASILEVKLKGNDPLFISDYLNNLLQSYLNMGLEQKNRIATSTIDFIDEQISGVSDSLQAVESNFQKFRSSNKVINISTEGNFTMQKMESLLTQKGELQRAIKYYDYLFEYINVKDDFKDIIAPSTMGIQDAMLNTLVKNLSELYSKRSILLLSAREKSPQIIQINIEIDNTRNALVENMRNIIKSSQISIEELDRQIAIVDVEIKKLPKTEREYITIQRNFTLNDNIYTFLLQKRSEAGIALASNVSDHKILDKSQVDNTLLVSPNKLQNYIIGIVLGILFALIYIFLTDFFNTKITDLNHFESHLKAPLLAHIGHTRNQDSLFVYNNPRSSVSESFRALRTNLQFVLPNEQSSPQILMVTSSKSGEGKTFCASNLATIIALSDKKTLVVGLDLRKPTTHNQFNTSNDKGLSNYLINNATLAQITHRTEVDNLFIIPSGPIPPNPAELLETKRMTEFVEAIKEIYEFIIFDTPPIALVSDALILNKYIDATLFVVRHDYTEKNALKFINSIQEQKKITKLNVVINDVKFSKFSNNSYGYGYGISNDGSGYYSD